jgi:hypothetical protein
MTLHHWITELTNDPGSTWDLAVILTKTPVILHLHHWIAELYQLRVYRRPTDLGGYQVLGRPGFNPQV